MKRILLPVLCALALSACGFHLRDAFQLPPDLGPVRVVAADRYSPLAQSLSQALTRAGAVPATEDAGMEVATLEVISEQWADTPIAVDQVGRAQEFSLRYAVNFALRKGAVDIVPPQQVELSRDYVAPAADSIGKASERELLAGELRREMSAAVMRRIDAVSRKVAAPR